MKRILFVCSGNTCRSPMAAAILNSLGDADFLASSAGLQAFSGDEMSRNALEALLLCGTPEHPEMPYSRHRSRPIHPLHLQEADLVVGMSARHSEILQAAFPEFQEKITHFPFDIPDPYGGDRHAYLSCLAKLRQGVHMLYREWKEDKNGIFPMISADIPAVLDIENKSFTVPWSEKSFCVSLENPCTHLNVSLLDGKVVGYSVHMVLFEDAELYNIATDSNHRRRGVGKKLLQNVIDNTQKRGGEELHLEVRYSNLSARALYESHGFQIEGKRKNYYQKPIEDAILMGLSVKK